MDVTSVNKIRGLIRMYIYAGHIPKDFAMAVHAIAHNQATFEQWELIDKYLTNKQPVFQWIESILKDNGTKPQLLKREMEWWKRQITTPHQ